LLQGRDRGEVGHHAAVVGVARAGEGDLVAVDSPRGSIEARARISGVREGVIFVPFHYGYWDEGAAGPDGRPRAANELTMTIWDPVSKQPLYKTAAARVRKVSEAEGPAPAPTTAASAPDAEMHG
jgi:predicted molibdopterin-dependent oxidoreductase YjgC